MADILNTFLTSLTILGIVKGMFMVGLVVYLAFAAIIVRQVAIMKESLEDPNNFIIQIFAWAHLLLTILLLVVSFVFL